MVVILMDRQRREVLEEEALSQKASFIEEDSLSYEVSPTSVWLGVVGTDRITRTVLATGGLGPSSLTVLVS